MTDARGCAFPQDDPVPDRITPNVFAISFGLAGLAEAWDTAARATGIPDVVASVLWIIVAAVWLATLVLYLANVVRHGRLGTELLDPVFAPFIAIAAIVPMLLGGALAAHARGAGVGVFVVGLVATVLIGALLSGQWILSDAELKQWHPGYFLPTVAGGLLASGTAASLGFPTLGWLMFGYGVVCWLVLGSILLLRLFTQPRLPLGLIPTMAIEVAPPVVAGAAWFALDGGRPDPVALAIAGYAGLMVLIQLRLAPLYRTVPFGLGWWAFSFSYCAVVVDGLRWLAAERAPHLTVWSAVLLAVASGAVLALVVRSITAATRGTFLPHPQPAAPIAAVSP
jgi:tellurite resistance protein